MSDIPVLTSILVLAALAEAVVEYLIRPLVNTLQRTPILESPEPTEPVDVKDLILRYLAVAVGILFAFAYRADLLQLFGLVPPWPWLGYLVTGLIIGRGSTFVHDFAGKWLGS